MSETEQLPPGTVEVDDSDSNRPVRVRFTLPQEWFTLPELRQFAAHLVTLADENESAPDIDQLAAVLETAAALSNPSPRAMARTLHNSGYRLAREPAEPVEAAEFDTIGTGTGPYAVREFTSDTGTYAVRYAPRDGVLIWTDRDYGPAACPVTEWLCVPCKTVHPWQQGDRLTRPCRRCGSAMIPTSPSVRMLENLRAEVEGLRAARR